MRFIGQARWVLLLTAMAGPDPALADKRAGTPDNWPSPMPDPGPFWMVQADRLETTLGESSNGYTWDINGWYGYDRRRLRWKSTGEGQWGERPETAELQVLYSHLFAPYWEWQLGVRKDTRPGDGRHFAVVGIEGTAPYQLDVDAAVFISEDGDVSARFEAEYDFLITQRWILQPRIELDAAISDVPAALVRGGTVDAELGLRLRYEVRREFAPYLGIAYERRHSTSATSTDTALVAGLHFWF